MNGSTNDLIAGLRVPFVRDEEYRNSYAESFMNSHVAAQIKVLRESQEMTQEELAERIGTKQTGVSRLENVNYSAWKVETLRKLARAFHVRLKITFEEFGTLPNEMNKFSRAMLMRRKFENDPTFSERPAAPKRPVLSESIAVGALESEQGIGQVAAADIREFPKPPAAKNAGMQTPLVAGAALQAQIAGGMR
jgi:transcriptional regulator with XRE-family HTH domain